MNLSPYLSFKGNCFEAFRFYETVFGSKIDMIMTYGDIPAGNPVPPDMGEKIMHASMRIGETVLMGSDAPPQFGAPPVGFSVCLNVQSPDEAEKIYAALSDGGAVRMPIGETFWAIRFAVLVDKFSIPWMINCERSLG